ncbi:MAG TPA: hypothetical protein VFE67_14305 [Rudaea sp.]|nr:hypothetical protein [Rudaea sp.]
MAPAPLLVAFSALLLACAGTAAGAKCPITIAQLYVGNKAGDPPLDADCDYDDIQPAIDAVAAGNCPVIVNITREHTYTSHHLNIAGGPPITLLGWGDGVTCQSLKNFCPISGCAQTSTQPEITISASNTAGSTLSISGSSIVSLRNLTITAGMTLAGGSGGGISFDGAGMLNLTATTVSYNYAGYGGGINIKGTGGNATLNLYENTLILSNTAEQSGGGVRLEGSANLVANAAQTLIAFNNALSDYGGGVEVLGPARADIGSGGYGGLGVIFSNDASYGGGIAVFASGNGFFTEPGVVNLFTTDPENPVRIQENVASIAGGAIYGKGHVDQENNQNEALLCASQFRIDENAAPDGAAVYVDWDSSLLNPDVGGRLLLNRGACGGGGVRCAADVPCNLIDHNSTKDTLGQPSSGALILIGSDSTFQADHVAMRSNTAGRLVNIVGGSYTNYRDVGLLRNCLLAGNGTSQDLLDLAAEVFTIDGCTIAGNTIGGSWVFPSLDTLTNSLIFQPGTAVGSAMTLATTKYVLSSDISHLPADVTIQQLFDPKFNDAAGGDYHLQRTSPAIDFAGGIGGDDLDYLPRDVDLPSTANKFGPRDVGAYERQSACGATDTLFCDGFEAD